MLDGRELELLAVVLDVLFPFSDEGISSERLAAEVDRQVSVIPIGEASCEEMYRNGLRELEQLRQGDRSDLIAHIENSATAIIAERRQPRTAFEMLIRLCWTHGIALLFEVAGVTLNARAAKKMYGHPNIHMEMSADGDRV